MTRGQLLVVFCCFSLSAVTSSTTDCVTDYYQNISCVISDDPDVNVYNYNNYNMKCRDWRGNSFSCPLVAVGNSYRGDCQVKHGGACMSSSDEYTIELCNETTCQSRKKEFVPIYNTVKLAPPPELELQQTLETINITCKSKRYQSHMYLKEYLHFEVLVQDSHASQNRTFQLYSENVYISIDRRSQLKPNTEYCFKVRFKPDKSTHYVSTWSEWSESTYWTNEAEDTFSERENVFIILLKYLSPVCVLAGAFLIIFHSPAARMKIKTLAHTPTPAPFFQPLFQKYEGNLQDWLSPRGKFAVTYDTETDLIAEAVTVLPKPITKDPEETQAFVDTSVPHMTFPLGPTSYVGLPGMNEVPLPIAVVCPGDTPYTQLPCSVWGFSFSDVQVVIPSAPPCDFLEMSHRDSGCDFEALSQSPERSLPCSPVEESVPRYCKDYCILNKTAEGVVPVLLSKESNENFPSDPLKDENFEQK
ncbi:interleukin-21 receptor-like [Kryptolebias marmoratus]|uniref:interleukin-21 receptor-like n=1 Tax=Kryptolebias marmoratus TaxID=37003 RepID=UPI0018AC98FE|nr:interleukin-21 receptor-like [Kryptolebias marmoratus]